MHHQKLMFNNHHKKKKIRNKKNQHKILKFPYNFNVKLPHNFKSLLILLNLKKIQVIFFIFFEELFILIFFFFFCKKEQKFNSKNETPPLISPEQTYLKSSYELPK